MVYPWDNSTQYLFIGLLAITFIIDNSNSWRWYNIINPVWVAVWQVYRWSFQQKSSTLHRSKHRGRQTETFRKKTCWFQRTWLSFQASLETICQERAKLWVEVSRTSQHCEPYQTHFSVALILQVATWAKKRSGYVRLTISLPPSLITTSY